MTKKKRILILAFNKLTHDARITRQIKFLKDDYQVDVFCFEKTDIADVIFIEVAQTPLTRWRKAKAAILLLGRQYERAYWMMHHYKDHITKLQDSEYDLIIANDVEALHMAFSISNKVFFDAHEYAPRHFEDKLWFRIFFQGFNQYFCEKYIPRVSGMTTVCDGLADEYEANFKVRPDIITNAPNYQDVPIKATNSDTIKIIHHGIANFSRKLETMIEVMDYLPTHYTLDLMLVTPAYASKKTKRYIADLKNFCKEKSSITIIPAVPSHEVVGRIKQYDIGLFLLEPVNFNYTFALPNKLFEFIQARLAVAIGPSPEMKKIVEEYKNGIVSKNFSAQSIANSIKKLSAEDLDKMKSQSAKAATVLNAENNKIILLELIKKMI